MTSHEPSIGFSGMNCCSVAFAGLFQVFHDMAMSSQSHMEVVDAEAQLVSSAGSVRQLRVPTASVQPGHESLGVTQTPVASRNADAVRGKPIR